MSRNLKTLSLVSLLQDSVRVRELLRRAADPRAKHLGLSVTSVIAAYALYNLTYTLASYPAGALADRIPKHLIVATGFIIFGVSYAGLGLATSPVWVWPLFALYGTYTALTDGVTKAWIVTLVPATAKGRALGLQAGTAGVGAIIAGTWAGLTWHGTGRTPLLIAGIMASLLGVGTLLTRRLNGQPTPAELEPHAQPIQQQRIWTASLVAHITAGRRRARAGSTSRQRIGVRSGPSRSTKPPQG